MRVLSKGAPEPGARGRAAQEAWRAYANARRDVIDAEEDLARTKTRIMQGREPEPAAALDAALAEHASAKFQEEEALARLRGLGEPIPGAPDGPPSKTCTGCAKPLPQRGFATCKAPSGGYLCIAPDGSLAQPQGGR